MAHDHAHHDTQHSAHKDTHNGAHHHGHHHHHATGDNLRLAFFLNLIFAIIEIFGGYYTHSLAIISNALHDAGDAGAIGIGWWLERKAEQGSHPQFSYGLRRLSLLGALINTLIIISGGVTIIAIAIPRLLHPEEIHASGMIAFAFIGIAVNGYGALRLLRDNTMNARVMAWHLYEDLLSWLVVLVVALVMFWRPIPILDPLLSIMVSLYVLFNVARNLKKTLALFLQAAPDTLTVNDVEKHLHGLTNVRSSHHTHIWSLDGERHVLTTHLVVNSDSSQEDLQSIKQAIHAYAHQHGFAHTTIEIEYANHDCSMEH